MNKLLVLAFLFIVLLLMSGCKCEHISITKDVSFERTIGFVTIPTQKNSEYTYYLMFHNKKDREIKGEYFFVRVYPENDLLGRDIEEIYFEGMLVLVHKGEIRYLDEIT